MGDGEQIFGCAYVDGVFTSIGKRENKIELVGLELPSHREEKVSHSENVEHFCHRSEHFAQQFFACQPYCTGIIFECSVRQKFNNFKDDDPNGGKS